MSEHPIFLPYPDVCVLPFLFNFWRSIPVRLGEPSTPKALSLSLYHEKKTRAFVIPHLAPPSGLHPHPIPPSADLLLTGVTSFPLSPFPSPTPPPSLRPYLRRAPPLAPSRRRHFDAARTTLSSHSSTKFPSTGTAIPRHCWYFLTFTNKSANADIPL
jgi:hypothetical protein